MLKITIDSNSINTRQKDSALNQLEKWHKEKIIEIVGTERLLLEMEKWKGNKDALNKAKGYKNISEPIVIGQWRVGHGYISGDDENYPSFDEIAEVLFPKIPTDELNENQSNDIMHIISHVHSDSNIFVTNDTDILGSTNTVKSSKAKILKDKWEIIVMKPEDCVIYIKSTL